MGDFKGPDNIYWLFSSSAQAIAAFIGFLAAGFFFSYDRIDKHVEKDETLEDIYNDIRKQFYNRIKTLFILTGLSIILSLVVVYLNGFDLYWFGCILKILVGLLNIVTIVWAIFFVLFIIDPDKVKKTAEKLVKENRSFFTNIAGQTLTRGAFIDKFIHLEKLLRALAEKYEISVDANSRFRNFLPVSEIIKILLQRDVIDKQQFYQLIESNKLRNLAAHGNIQHIEKKFGETVESLVKALKVKLENNS